MNKHMTPEQLKVIKDRAEAATVGPWERFDVTDVFTKSGATNNDGLTADSYDGWLVADCESGLTSVNGELVGTTLEEMRDNAEFITHAREDVPALLAEVERLRDNLRTIETMTICTTTRDFAKRALSGDATMNIIGNFQTGGCKNERH